MGEGDAEVEAPAFMPGEDVHSRKSSPHRLFRKKLYRRAANPTIKPIG